MGKHFNNKVLLTIPVIFLIVVILRISYAYYDTNKREYVFAKEEADVLSSYAMTHRDYYQSFFIKKIIPLNIQTLPALPAYSSRPISDRFSKDNPLNITIKTVSQRARNKKNKADIYELEAIRFFEKNKDAQTCFTDIREEFYQYAKVLRVEQKCLKCHGKKENAPKFIQDRYNDAYDYKLGEIRGILSIKIPKKYLDNYFFKNFMHSVIYDILLLLALFATIYYLSRKSKTINEFLGNEVEKKTKELRNSLIFDSLTNLPNRVKLLEDINSHKESHSRHLALLNIDGFKDINDFYGHEAGDKIIKDIALKIMELCVGEGSNVYRLQSDEYAIFSVMHISNERFFDIVKNIIQNIEQTRFSIDDNEIFLTLSCGLASNVEPLLIKADIALKSAKNDKTDLLYYSEKFDMNEQIRKNIKGIKLLKTAILQDAIVPYFQPIYNVNTNRVEKYESLARIVLEDGKVIPPFEFLDIAIKSKLYPQLTKMILKKAFDFFKDKEYEFSINLSIDDVLNKQTVKFIKNELNNFPQPSRVVFEILEDEKVGNYQELRDFIVDIKQYGCKFALDDFGSGYSNFAHILELNVDYLKIDASLVKYIMTDKNSKVITKTIIDFASSLGLKTIAEFVEDKESLEMLKEMGVDFIQGYYIGKPQKNLYNG